MSIHFHARRFPRVLAVAMAVALAPCHVVHALDARLLEQQRKSTGACDTPETRPSPDMTQQYTWSGACVDGWRDGKGRLTMTITSSFAFGDTRQTYVTSTTTEGEFSQGYPRGLWCNVGSRSGPADKPKLNESVGVCRFAYDGASLLYDLGLRRTEQGDWQTESYARTPQDVFLKGADVEALNAKALQAAPGPHPEVPLLHAKSPFLTDLLANGEIDLLPKEITTAEFGQKRVALILSTRTTQSLARWRAQREAFAKENGYGQFSDPKVFGPDYNVVLAQTDPATMLRSWMTALRPLADKVVAARDLGVLARGEADVALVLDWTYEGGLMTAAEFRKIPACKPPADCPHVLDQQMTALLIDRNLKLRGIASATTTANNSQGDYRKAIGYATNSLSPEEGSGLVQGFAPLLASKFPGGQLTDIGLKYETGKGVKADKFRAAMYYLYASGAGDAFGRYKLALAYRDGNGLTKDVPQGVKLLHEASELGSPDASALLTVMYSSDNSGVTKDIKTAARYARLAYRQKADPWTSYNMGIITANGWDEAADPVAATRYFTEAQQLGHKDAATRIAELAPKVAALQAPPPPPAPAPAATPAPVADATFVDSLKAAPNAGALYAIADEAAEKGLKANARAAFRSLMTRFPDSPLAAKAADRLAAL